MKKMSKVVRLQKKDAREVDKPGKSSANKEERMLNKMIARKQVEANQLRAKLAALQKKTGQVKRLDAEMEKHMRQKAKKVPAMQKKIKSVQFAVKKEKAVVRRERAKINKVRKLSVPKSVAK